jgi:hypothetical protein
MPTGACPKSCATSAECDALAGEICCTSIVTEDKSLGVPGLCLAAGACPKTCTSSAECRSALGEICCAGLCNPVCPCNTDADCDGEVCCQSPASSLPPKPVLYLAAQHCTGTPSGTCAACLSDGCGCPGCTPMGGGCFGTAPASCADCGVGCATCLGCTAGPGACQGTPQFSTCAQCGTCGCPGCTQGAGVCSGTPSACILFNGNPTGCTAAGCSYTTNKGTCAGTPHACSTYGDQTSCETQGCGWALSCTGDGDALCAARGGSLWQPTRLHVCLDHVHGNTDALRPAHGYVPAASRVLRGAALGLQRHAHAMRSAHECDVRASAGVPAAVRRIHA